MSAYNKTGGTSGSNQYGARGTAKTVSQTPPPVPTFGLMEQTSESTPNPIATIGWALEEKLGHPDPAAPTETLAQEMASIASVRGMLADVRDQHVDRLSAQVGAGVPVPLRDGGSVQLSQGKPRDRWDHEAIWQGISDKAATSTNPEQTVIDEAKSLVGKGTWSSQGLREGVGIDPDQHSTAERGDLRAVITGANRIPTDLVPLRDRVYAGVAVRPGQDAQSHAQAISDIEGVREQLAQHSSRYEELLTDGRVPRGETIELPDGGEVAIHRDVKRTGWQHDAIWNATSAKVLAGAQDGGSGAERSQRATGTVREAVGTAKWRKNSVVSAGLGDSYSVESGKWRANISQSSPSELETAKASS